jgi:hypothetical protein
MSHAKAQREEVGYDGRVCVAVLVHRFGTREQIDGDDHFANVASGVDRGTYQGSHVSRKGATKTDRGGADHVSRKEAKAQRRPTRS